MESSSSADDKKMTFKKRMKALEDEERTIEERIEKGILNIVRLKPNLTESEMSVIGSLFNKDYVLMDAIRTKKKRLARLEKARCS